MRCPHFDLMGWEGSWLRVRRCLLEPGHLGEHDWEDG